MFFVFLGRLWLVVSWCIRYFVVVVSGVWVIFVICL